jgi:hypothetical protein
LVSLIFNENSSSSDQIVHLLSNNENQQLGLENLEGMLKILPDANEVLYLKLNHIPF